MPRACCGGRSAGGRAARRSRPCSSPPSVPRRLRPAHPAPPRSPQVCSPGTARRPARCAPRALLAVPPGVLPGRPLAVPPGVLPGHCSPSCQVCSPGTARRLTRCAPRAPARDLGAELPTRRAPPTPAPMMPDGSRAPRQLSVPAAPREEACPPRPRCGREAPGQAADTSGVVVSRRLRPESVSKQGSQKAVGAAASALERRPASLPAAGTACKPRPVRSVVGCTHTHTHTHAGRICLVHRLCTHTHTHTHPVGPD